MDLTQILVPIGLVVGALFAVFYVLWSFKDAAEAGVGVLVMGIPGVIGAVIGVVTMFLVGPTTWAFLNCGPGNFTFKGPACLQLGDACVAFREHTPLDDLRFPWQRADLIDTLFPVGNVCDVSGLLVTPVSLEWLGFFAFVWGAIGAIAVWVPWRVATGRSVSSV